MKIILAPDKFKSNMTSPQICGIMEKAFHEVYPDWEIISLPLADGGDGTTRALAAATRAELRTVRVMGPLGKDVEAEYAYNPQERTGVMEMASASGIALVDRKELNPLKATTFGTGQVIRQLLDDGAKEITIGIGGSATVDGGAGMAQALGFKFLDQDGRELGLGAAALAELERIDCSAVDPRLKEVKISVACDVTSPLLGPDGAAYVFGPQKGATPEMVEILEKNLSALAQVWLKQGYLESVAEPGDGAAGGLGAGLRAFCHAVSCSGARLIMKASHFEEHLRGADLVITGEGQTDSQTESGKLCSEVAAVAHAAGVPVMLLSGALVGELVNFNNLFDYAFSISCGHVTLEDALKNGPQDLAFFTYNLAKIIKGFSKK